MSAKKPVDPKENSNQQKGKPAQNEAKGGALPPLMEIGFSLASFLMVAVPIAVALVSFFSNAEPLDIILRMAVTVAAMGILSCILLRLLNHGILKSSQEQIIDALENQRDAAREFQA